MFNLIQVFIINLFTYMFIYRVHESCSIMYLHAYVIYVHLCGSYF